MVAFISQLTVYASYAPFVEVEREIKTPVTSQNAPERAKVVRGDYSEIIEKYSLKWQVSPVLTSRIIYCESGNNRYALNDTPGREYSVGLAQINILAHTNITKEQAQDPEFAINFITENISKGNAPQMWYTCFRKANY